MTILIQYEQGTESDRVLTEHKYAAALPLFLAV
jgi:hypothetical protein